MLANVRQQFTVPGCPWMNGRIERVFGTLKDKLDRIRLDGQQSLQRLLADFGFWYNEVRPHQNLGGEQRRMRLGMELILTPTPRSLRYGLRLGMDY